MGSKVTAEQVDRLWIRCQGLCECGCGMLAVATAVVCPGKAEVHHIRPKGMGGTTHQYEDCELMILRLECHDLEESKGYPHRESWIQEMREKEGL